MKLLHNFSLKTVSACLLMSASYASQAVIIESEDYSAFFDTTSGNSGGAYRSGDVDIEETSDIGGGYSVGWIESTEWLTYNNISFPTTGNYTIRLRVASPNAGGTVTVDLDDGSLILGTASIPNTGGWQNWQTVTIDAYATAGTYSLGTYAAVGGWNLNWIEVVQNNDDTGGGDDSGGNCTSWQAGTQYDEGDVVSYNGAYYVAEHSNPGYDPIISTWFWEPTSQCDGDSGTGGDDNDNNDCGSTWHAARLTNYESYPDPGSDECTIYNGCQWAGYFYGIDGQQTESWVEANDIIAVHLQDWSWLGLQTMNLRQGNKRITGTVYDACSDADCNGCCTANLGGDGYLIDIEKYTMQRFGSGDGIVEFQVCN